eukprot:gene1173-1484_t
MITYNNNNNNKNNNTSPSSTPPPPHPQPQQTSSNSKSPPPPILPNLTSSPSSSSTCAPIPSSAGLPSPVQSNPSIPSLILDKSNNNLQNQKSKTINNNNNHLYQQQNNINNNNVKKLPKLTIPTSFDNNQFNINNNIENNSIKTSPTSSVSSSSSTPVQQQYSTGSTPRDVGGGEWRFWNSDSLTKCQRFHNLVYYRLGNLKFLAESLAELEPWGRELKILKIYMDNTFKRLVEENKILSYFSPKNPLNPILIVFHTGLISKNYEDIFCVLQSITVASSRDREQESGGRRCEERQWILKEFSVASSFSDPQIYYKYGDDIPFIPELPPRAFYYVDGIEHSVFDPRIPIDTENINFLEILKNSDQSKMDRLPPDYVKCSDQELMARFQFGIKSTIVRIKANPRYAVPQFHRDSDGTKRIDLLVPIGMSLRRGEFDSSLVIRLTPGEKSYQVRGLLSKEDAYINARVIQRTEQKWLEYPELFDIGTYTRKNNNNSLVNTTIPNINTINSNNIIYNNNSENNNNVNSSNNNTLNSTSNHYNSGIVTPNMNTIKSHSNSNSNNNNINNNHIKMINQGLSNNSILLNNEKKKEISTSTSTTSYTFNNRNVFSNSIPDNGKNSNFQSTSPSASASSPSSVLSTPQTPNSQLNDTGNTINDSPTSSSSNAFSNFNSTIISPSPSSSLSPSVFQNSNYNQQQHHHKSGYEFQPHHQHRLDSNSFYQIMGTSQQQALNSQQQTIKKSPNTNNGFPQFLNLKHQQQSSNFEDRLNFNSTPNSNNNNNFNTFLEKEKRTQSPNLINSSLQPFIYEPQSGSGYQPSYSQFPPSHSSSPSPNHQLLTKQTPIYYYLNYPNSTSIHNNNNNSIQTSGGNNNNNTKNIYQQQQQQQDDISLYSTNQTTTGTNNNNNNINNNNNFVYKQFQTVKTNNTTGLVNTSNIFVPNQSSSSSTHNDNSLNPSRNSWSVNNKK